LRSLQVMTPDITQGLADVLKGNPIETSLSRLTASAAAQTLGLTGDARGLTAPDPNTPAPVDDATEGPVTSGDLPETTDIGTPENTSSAAAELGIPVAVIASPSEARHGLWTNRVPQHEPWPRTLIGDPVKDPEATQKYVDVDGMLYQNIDIPQRYDVNRHHQQEFGADSAWVGRAEGDEAIVRNELWRR
jgi:hypothetical protein